MRVLAVIQARMSSSRLPGKVLMPLAGRPVLQFLLERLARSVSVTRVMVATSIDRSDDAIVEFCARRGVLCRRGPLDNVARRFRDAIAAEPCDALVRVNADSPLLDPRLIDQGVGHFCAGDYDLVTNTWPRSYPPGQSVEVLAPEAFCRAYDLMTEAADFEHVTRVYYRRADDFRIHNFSRQPPCTETHLAVDTAEDFERIEHIVARMTRPQAEYSLDGILRLHAEVGGLGAARGVGSARAWESRVNGEEVCA